MPGYNRHTDDFNAAERDLNFHMKEYRFWAKEHAAGRGDKRSAAQRKRQAKRQANKALGAAGVAYRDLHPSAADAGWRKAANERVSKIHKELWGR